MAYRTINGVKLYYEIRGNEEGEETVAFFNGVMASVNSWSLQSRVFERFGHRVLLHDFKGQLLSEKPTHSKSMRKKLDCSCRNWESKRCI